MTGLLVGCGGTRGVTLRVTDASGAGVEHALVRAITVDDSPVPLPVTLEVLQRMATEARTVGYTDAGGRIRLAIDDDVAYVVEVLPPPLGPQSLDPMDASRWVWVLSGGGDAVRADAARRNVEGLELSVE